MNGEEFMIMMDRKNRTDAEILERIEKLTKSISKKYNETYVKLRDILKQKKDKFKIMEDACEKLNLYGDIGKREDLTLHYSYENREFSIFQNIENDKKLVIAKINDDSQYPYLASSMGVSYNIAIRKYNHLIENINGLLSNSLRTIDDRFDEIARLYEPD